jgi:tetraacyldisaccharide-1-P 4'-kinase
LKARQKAGAACFVTTEKDAINLEAFWAELEPIHVAPVYMQIEDANAVAKTLWAAVAARNSRPA